MNLKHILLFNTYTNLGYNPSVSVQTSVPVYSYVGPQSKFLVAFFVVVTLLFGFFCGRRGFCYRTESDLFPFFSKYILAQISRFQYVQYLKKNSTSV